MTQPEFTQLLVAADSVEAANRLISSLRADNVAVRSASTANENEFASLLTQGQWDVVLSYPSARLPLRSVLAALQRAELDIAALSVEAASGAQAAPGVRDTIPPQDHARLLAAVKREAEISRLKRRVRQLELQQRELEKRHALLMDGSSTAIAYIQDGIHLACNSSYARCFGYENIAAITTVPLLDLLSTDARPAIKALLSQGGRAIAQWDTERRETLRIRKQNGAEEAMELCFTAVEYHGKPCVQLTVSSARGDTGYAAVVAQIGNQDLLTRLDNAEHFMARIEHAIHAAVQDNRYSSLLLIEIQDFADITAAIGRSSGNIVLNDVARLLRELIAPQDAAARLDDSTFAVLVQDGDPDSALTLARAIQGRVNNRVSSAMLTSLELGCAIGMALVNDMAGDAETVLARARANLRDKPLSAEGKFQYRIGEGLHHDAGTMLDYLRAALLNKRFKLLFQPLVPINGSGLKSYEVLSRMLDRDGNEVSPAAFLPLANLNGIGEEIDRLVIGLALDSMKESATERLLINVTSNTLMSRTFLPWLSDKLRGSRIASDLLILQVSEVDIHGNPAQTLAFCRGLKQLNAGMAICHFGCALDPFAVLASLAPTLVKLDETLMRDIIYSPQQRENVRMQIGKLHDLGLLVVAPQVEDMDVLPVLWQTGADYVQGYCLQRPSDEMNYEFVHVEEITLPAASN